MKKFIIILLTLILITITVIIGYFFLQQNEINKSLENKLEIAGKKLFGKEVSINSVDVNITKGKGEVNGIKVKDLLSIKNIDIDVDISSIARDTKVINRIRINDVKGRLVLQADGLFNVSHIQKYIQKKLSKEKTKIETKIGKKSKNKKDYDPNIIIKEIIINNIQMEIDLSIIKAKAFTVKMDVLDIYNIGGKKGLPASQIGGIVTNKLLSEILKTVGEKLTETTQQNLMKTMKNKANKLFKNLF